MYRRGWFQESYRHYLAGKGITTRRYNAPRLAGLPSNYQGSFNIGEQLWKARTDARVAARREVAGFEDEGKRRATARVRIAEEQLFGRLVTPEEAMRASTALMDVYLKQGAEVRLRDERYFQVAERDYGLTPGSLFGVVYDNKELDKTKLFTQQAFDMFSTMPELKKGEYRLDIDNKIFQARAEVGRTKNQAVVAVNDAAKYKNAVDQGNADERDLPAVMEAQKNSNMLYAQAERRLKVWESIKRQMEDSMNGVVPEDLRSVGQTQQSTQTVQPETNGGKSYTVTPKGRIDTYAAPGGNIEVFDPYQGTTPADLARMQRMFK